MKRIALVVAAILLAFSGFAQKQPKFTEEDAKHFYRTMQGDYTMIVNDSTTADVQPSSFTARCRAIMSCR